MKKLQINLGAETEVRWHDVSSLPEFKYTTQQGVLDALCVVYLQSKNIPVPRVFEDD